MAEKSRRRRVYISAGIGICAAMLFWWFFIRDGAPTFSPWITWSTTGTPNAITFYVTRNGAPVPGFKLDTKSNSGTSGEEITDLTGRATFRPAESEVVSIFLEGREILLRPLPFGETFCLPKCNPHGLTFYISL